MPAIPTQGSDPNKGSGDWLTEECDAMLVVEDYKEVGAYPDENWHCLISAYVHTSTVPSQVGKKVKDERFYFLKGANRIFEFSCALGLYSKPQWDADVAAGANPTIPLENSVGLMFATQVRHKKWDERRDPQYWQEQLQIAQQNNDQKKVERCQQRLAEKRGAIQIGGPSGFTFFAVGDLEADHIPLSQADIYAISPQGILPTKQGVPRKRGSAAGPSMPATRSTAPAGNGNAAARQPAQSAPAAAGSGVGSSFF